MADDKVIPVRVALRSRPLVTKEIVEGCQISIQFVPNEPQVILGRDKAFTFDYTFALDSKQSELYNKAVADRIEYIFKGYNVTVLAYGQTGSGKTYTMGTAYSSSQTDDESEIGVIQRAVNDIFSGIDQRAHNFEYIVKVSFLEVYKEDVYDLLNKNKDTNSPITIREDGDGIKIVGLTEMPVHSALETLHALEQGSLCRTTASTAMNARSSRSHAIFSVIVEQRNLKDPADFTRAKFHLVDLAGSERANKTGALGERFKEGVKINKGLLALGNVISALGDDSSHIPYRDSKLTRLLQDSLGGNSHTVMIACVSPADSNLEETLNTLRYADRARKIKNKPVVNRDPQNAELVKLRQEIQLLKLQLLGSKVIEGAGVASSEEKDRDIENMRKIIEHNKDLEGKQKRMEKELHHSLDQITLLCEKSVMAEAVREKFEHEFEELRQVIYETIDILKKKVENEPIFKEQLQWTLNLKNKMDHIYDEYVKKHREFSLFSACKAMETIEPFEMEKIKCDDEVTIANNNYEETRDVEIIENDNHLDSSTLKQAAMTRELEELDRALALKEGIAEKMKLNDTQISVMRMHFETNLKQMEEEIAVLQKEKEDLANALKAAKATANLNKVSEQRRKRLQECEAQIAQLKKQILEKGKIMKIKDDAARKVAALQQEIQSMKSMRVKLVKRMREEADKYRMMSLKKDREVAQLKQHDRRREFEMVRLKQEFSKQKNVLKRKMEEATAANKRLNDALSQQKSVAERRMKEKQGTLQGIGTRVQQWLVQEMEVVLSSKEANFFLKNLLDDRKTISQQLNILKAVEYPEKMSEEDTEERNETRLQIKALEQELEMRNVQISELQQKILDADQEEKRKQRWETIQGMTEAKCALQWLFDKSVNAMMDVFHQKSEFETNVEESNLKINTYKVEIQRLNEIIEHTKEKMLIEKQEYEYERSKLVHENEDKTLYLLRQLNSNSKDITSDADSKSELMERINFQENEILRLSYLNEELQKMSAENQHLRSQLAQARMGKKTNLLGDFSAMQSTFIVPSKKDSKDAKEDSAMKLYLDDSLTSATGSENDENDPDWRLTPLHKRTKTKRTFVENSNATGDSSESDSKRKKLSISCRCQSNCKTRRCRCLKNNKTCCETCQCKLEKCQNRSKNGDQESLNNTYQVSDSSISTCNSPSQTVLSEVNGNSKQDRSVDVLWSNQTTKQPEKLLSSQTEPEIKQLINEGGMKKKLFGHYSTLGPLKM